MGSVFYWWGENQPRCGSKDLTKLCDELADVPSPHLKRTARTDGVGRGNPKFMYIRPRESCLGEARHPWSRPSADRDLADVAFIGGDFAFQPATAVRTTTTPDLDPLGEPYSRSVICYDSRGECIRIDSLAQACKLAKSISRSATRYCC